MSEKTNEQRDIVVDSEMIEAKPDLFSRLSLPPEEWEKLTHREKMDAGRAVGMKGLGVPEAEIRKILEQGVQSTPLIIRRNENPDQRTRNARRAQSQK